MPSEAMGWQQVRDAVMARIRDRSYPPGALIPNEAHLAVEFGCARTTVNRALRALADAGFLDRRRKGGTRVTAAPIRKAVLPIGILRHEVEARGAAYSFDLVRREIAVPPSEVAEVMRADPARPMLNLITLHRADGRPVAREERWVDHSTVPAIMEADLTAISVNEWLVRNAPYTHGTLTFAAEPAGTRAALLGCAPGDSLLVMTRTTWMDADPITHVRQFHPPGHALTLQM